MDFTVLYFRSKFLACSLAQNTTCFKEANYVPTNTNLTKIGSDSASHRRIFYFLTLALVLRIVFGLNSHLLHVSANHEYRLESHASSDQCNSTKDRLLPQRLNQQESTHHRKSAVTGSNFHGIHDLSRSNRTNGGVCHLPPALIR